MQRNLRTLWPFLWLLCVWIYVVTPFPFSTGVDLGKRNEAQVAFPFTVLLFLHAGLYTLSHFHLLPRRWHWLYIVAQSGLVLSMSLVVSSANTLIVGGALFLALIGEAVSIWRTRGPVTLTVIGSVLLFLLSILLRGGWIAFHHVLLYLVPVILVATGYIVLYLRLARAHEQTQVLLGELEAAHHELATYAVRIEDLTLTNERQRLARELHDTLAQGLVGLTLQLDTADALLTEESYREAQEIVQQAMTRARATLAAARCAIDDLRSEASGQLTCSEAVQEEIRRFSTATGIACQTDLAALTAITPPFQEHVLRVVTEGLMNVARHAQANHVWVHTVQQDNTLTLDIGDDGIGFDLDAVAMRAGHYGLLGLRERARLIGGRLEVKSAAGMGTTVRLSFPQNREEGEQCRVGTTRQKAVSVIQGAV